MSLWKEAERWLTVEDVMEGNSKRLSLPGDIVMLKSLPMIVKG